MKLKIYAAEEGKTIKAVVEEWLTDLVQSSSARLSGVNPHEPVFARVQQEALLCSKELIKLHTTLYGFRC